MARSHFLFLGAALVCLCAAFLLWHLRAPTAYILELRAARLAALICVGAASGAATILFQTVAMNRLLTPGIVGFDALFVLMQTLLVAVFGSGLVAGLSGGLRFLAEAALLMTAATLLFGGLLRRGAADVTRMILTGVVLGVLLRGVASLVQRLLDPSEFAVVQQAMFASFGQVDPAQLMAAIGVLGGALIAAWRMAPALDVAALGRGTARGLGLGHDRVVLIALLLVAAMVSVSTALVGPITFLGLLCAGIARHLADTHRHAVLIPAAALIGVLILVLGQFVFERVLSGTSALAVVVELFGGLLFLFLVLKGPRR